MSLRYCLLFLFLSLPMAHANTEATPLSQLSTHLQQSSSNVWGEYGLYIHHIERDETIRLEAEKFFPMASVVKFPLSFYFLEQLQANQGHLSDLLSLTDEDKRDGSGLLKHLPLSDTPWSLGQCLSLMLRFSDNTATDALLQHFGGLPEITTHFEQHWPDIHVNRDMNTLILNHMGLPALPVPDAQTQAEYDYFSYDKWHRIAQFYDDLRDQATPEALGTYWTQALNHPQWPNIQRLLSSSRARLGGNLPAGVQFYHKTGTVTGSINDTGLLVLPNGEHVIIVALSRFVMDSDQAESFLSQVGHDVAMHYLYYASFEKKFDS